MKQTSILLTMAITAMLMLTGCSKDSESMGTKDNTELTKEQIVGVWRSGDYWVSFSESGFNSSFFNINGDERIDEGSFTIKENTIEVEHTLYYGQTKYVINKITPTTLQLTVEYNYYAFSLSDDDDIWLNIPMTLTKSSETPSERENGLDGVTYSDESTLTYKGTVYDVTQTNTIHSGEHGHYIDFVNDYHGNKPDSDYGGVPERGMKIYVYLAPYLYTAECETAGGPYRSNTPVQKIQIP